jgi:biopolymer transport protein ExbD
MAFGTRDNSDEVMNEINITPLVDVMLVLLIIFIITVPVMKHSVNIDLPQASNEAQNPKPQTMRLDVDADGNYFLDETRIADTELAPHFQAAAARTPQPDLHIRGDRAVRYERVAQAMALAQRVGLSKISFITEPAN